MSGDPLNRETVKDIICDRISGGESLNGICREEGMPHKVTVFRWLADDENFRNRYARARETQADALFDEVLSIADTEEDTNKARVRIDARKWMAGKLRPKVYGEKVVIGGDDTLDPIKTEETGSGAAKLIAALDAIASRTTGQPDPE